MGASTELRSSEISSVYGAGLSRVPHAGQQFVHAAGQFTNACSKIGVTNSAFAKSRNHRPNHVQDSHTLADRYRSRQRTQGIKTEVK